MNKIFKFLSLFFIKIVPVKKNLFVFISYGGSYNDNPKNIYEKMILLNKNLDIVWLVNKESIKYLSKGCKYALINTIKGYYYLGSANIIIDNNYCSKSVFLYGNSLVERVMFSIEKWLKSKKNQILYSTWHGTPLKKMGIDQINSKIIDFECKNMTMLFGNEYVLRIMKHLCFDKIKTELIGSPRNDILFCTDKKTIDKYKKKLDLPLDKKIILFAPSFRTDANQKDNINRSGLDQLNSIDFDVLFNTLNKKFGGDWVFICRFHYHVSASVDWTKIEKKYNGRVINGNKCPEMSEYLLCSDILVSDISSCLFDFAITNKPSFIYFPDYDYYSKEERGLYLDLATLPFQFSMDSNSFIDTIKDFDDVKYNKEIEKMKNKLGYCEDGKASKKIAEYILKENKML